MDILAVFHLAEPMGSMDCKDDSYYYEVGLGMQSKWEEVSKEINLNVNEFKMILKSEKV